MKSIAALTAAAALLFAAPLAAQQQRPMRVILPVSAGSGVDAIVRAAASALSDALAQPVVVENLPGAGGITGTSALVKAAPDGTTVAVVSNNHVTNPAVYKSLPYDSLADITPIAIIGATPFVLVVNPKKLPVNNAKELVALLKANPGKYNYASSGNGTIIHLGGAMFADAAGVEITHVPYKGMGPMISDLMGGQVDLGVASLPSVQGQLKSGALRAIGVTGSQGTPAAPELPTLAEQGLTGMDVAGWFAVVGPARLPASEVKRIHDAFANAYATPAVREAMAKQGNDIHVSTSEEAARFFREETARYAVLVKKIGLTID